MRIDLFVVDGLNDFCATGNESWNAQKKRGALFVENADIEAQLAADMIERLTPPDQPSKLAKIHSFCDEHHKNDIAHPGFWKKPDGSHPDPFTGPVTLQDVESHRLSPVLDGLRPRVIDYIKKLEKRGRNPLIIWPEHCLFKTWGACTYKPLADAFDMWCARTGGWINFIDKGRFPLTEHYGGFEADVPDDDHQDTKFNTKLVPDLEAADKVAWIGWAGSHCLKWTASDGINYFTDPSTGNNDLVKKSVFFEDGSAPVVSPDPGQTKMFAQWRKDFLDEMDRRGATITTTTAFLKG